MTNSQCRHGLRLLAVLLAYSILPGHACAADVPPFESAVAGVSAIEEKPVAVYRAKHADFGTQSASREARHVADWVVDSGDNQGMPFSIVDKVEAKVFVFDADGRMRGAAAALLGIAKGDHTAPGVGDRELSAIRLQDRTTPAGRFVASLGRNYNGKDILWVDYASAVSMHRVINTKPMERRPHRLATPTPLDNRISFGCINVPIRFFEDIVSPAFTGTNGIVYVLPETRPARELFSSYDVEERAQMRRAQSLFKPGTAIDE